jgi:hypothetical protein
VEAAEGKCRILDFVGGFAPEKAGRINIERK